MEGLLGHFGSLAFAPGKLRGSRRFCTQEGHDSSFRGTAGKQGRHVR